MKFSQRMGFVQVNNVIQLDSINSDLRNDLWNFLYDILHNHSSVNTIIWKEFFKNPADEYDGYRFVHIVKAYFFSCEWYIVYDLIEFVLNLFGTRLLVISRYARADILNDILAKELAGFRFIEGKFVAITDEQELESVQTALATDGVFGSAKEHLITALQHLSNKTNPDFRNSIKESISAVEAIVRLICGDPKITLGEGIKRLKSGGNPVINRVLLEGLDKLYARTNTEGGARHAMNEGDETLGLDDAKFMLVTCSAFMNYLITKGFK